MNVTNLGPDIYLYTFTHLSINDLLKTTQLAAMTTSLSVISGNGVIDRK